MLGIALEGGGAKGAFHIGAMKALLEQGYRVDGAVGTSIGAFNAALICQGDFEKAYEFWNKVEPSTLFDIEDEHMKRLVHAEVSKETLRYLSNKTKGVIGNKGIDTSKLRGVLDEFIDEELIRTSEVDFGLVTVSLSELRPLELYKEDIPEGMMKDYIMASANLPGFKMIPIKGKYYIDGGVHDNCAVNLLIRKGYDTIIAVRTNQTDKLPKHIKSKAKIININPSEALGSTLLFDNELIQKNITMGYYDTMRMIQQLKGRKYYIKPCEESLFFDSFAKMPEEIIFQLGEVLKCPKMECKRMLFEKIIPTLAELLKLPLTATYQDIFIGLLEVLAKKSDILRFQVYELYDFICEIEKLYQIEPVEERKLRHLFNLKKLKSQLLGGHMLDEVAYVILDTVSAEVFDIKKQIQECTLKV